MTTIITAYTKTVCLILSLLTLFVIVPLNNITVKAANTTKAVECDFVPLESPSRTNWNTQSPNDNNTKNCVIPKFDPALGVLSSVNLKILGKIYAAINIKNGNPKAVEGIISKGQATITATTPTGINVVAIPTISYTDNLAGCEQKCGETKTNPNGSVTVLSAPEFDSTSQDGSQINHTIMSGNDTKNETITSNLEKYIGTGNNTYSATAEGGSSINTSGNFAVAGIINAGARLSVSYTYLSFATANNGDFSNSKLGENVDLSKSLSNTNPDGFKVSKYTIKTTPDPVFGELYHKDSTGKDILVSVGTSLTSDQTKTLYFKPKSGSEGKIFDFTYTTTSVDYNSKEYESKPATIKISLRTNAQNNPTETLVVSNNTAPKDNCTKTGTLNNPTDITDCFDIKSTTGEAIDRFEINNFRTGKNKNGESCGDFYIVKNNGDKIKLTNPQDLITKDSNIIFTPNGTGCEVCDIGMDIIAIDINNKKAGFKKVDISIAECSSTSGGIGGGFQIKDQNSSQANKSDSTIRTGGFTKIIQEYIILIFTLLGAMLFFFSNITSEKFKKLDKAK